MNEKSRTIINDMLEEVSKLEAGNEKDLEKIWDRNYGKVAMSVNTYEEEFLRIMHELFNTFIKESIEKYSFECDYCGDVFLGEPFMFQGESHCENCYDQHKDDFHENKY